MSFAGDLERFAAKMRLREQAVFLNSATAVQMSIKEGSAVTGAPGQPVDTGTLKNSWILRFTGPSEAIVSTNISYAPVIEYNTRAKFDASGTNGRYGVAGGRIGPALAPSANQRRVKSTVGGHHSVAMTRAAWPRLVDDEARKLAR